MSNIFSWSIGSTVSNDLSGSATGSATATGTLVQDIVLTGVAGGSAEAKLRSYAEVQFIGEGVVLEDICDDLVEVPDYELRARLAFPKPTLELLRAYALASCSTDNSLASQARAVMIFGMGKDFQPLFRQLVSIPREIQLGRHCDRRRTIDVDKRMAVVRPLLGKALAELRSMGVPEAYLEVLQVRLESHSFTHRVAANCALVVLAAILLRGI